MCSLVLLPVFVVIFTGTMQTEGSHVGAAPHSYYILATVLTEAVWVHSLERMLFTMIVFRHTIVSPQL